MKQLRAGLKAFLFALLLTGCGAKQLRPDAIQHSAMESNYPTAEFAACGQLWNGLGECHLETGQSLDSIALSVQGYYRGVVKFAHNCGQDNSPIAPVRYSNNAKVPFFIPGKASQSCGVTFVVSPEYPNENDLPFKIYSFLGHIWIKVTDSGIPYEGQVLKVKSGEGPSNVLKFPVLADDLTVDFSFSSPRCEITKSLTNIPVMDHVVEIPLDDLLHDVPVKTCIINGIMYGSGVPLRISVLMSGYDSSFDPLPIPVVTFKEGKIWIEGDENVSIVSIDGSYDIDHQSHFEFDQTKPHLIRMLTVKARSILGVYLPGEGIEWIL